MSKIVKRGDDLRIVGYIDLNKDGNSTDSDIAYDVILIEGPASRAATGVQKATDVLGKPDRNDVWVFNTSPVDVYVHTYDGSNDINTTLESGEIKLFDIRANTSTPINYTTAVANSTDDLSIETAAEGFKAITTSGL